MKIFKKIREGERGAAIVIALGIFALILALGLHFASQSIIKDKIAQNLDSKTRSELFSRSAMNRLLAEMTANDNLEDLYSAGSEDNVDTLLSVTINKLNYEGNPGTEWIYLYNKSPGSSDSEIIGRLAYSLCSPDTSNYGGIGKLNAAACVDSGVNAANQSTLTYAISENATISTSINAEGGTIQGRPGVNVNEIYLKALDNAFTSDSLKGLSAENTVFENGLLPVYDSENNILTSGGNWPDFATLLKAIDVDTSSDIWKRLFRKLSISSTPDPEAFWIHDIDDVTVDTDELYHRFNLTRTDWDSLSISDFTDQTSLRFNSDDADTDGTTIPWLKNWKNAGGMGSPTNCRNQVIANLIDYCDSDTAATTDNENSPTYTGNDETPYINELFLHLQAHSHTISHPEVGEITFTTVWFREIAVELVNIYSDGTSGLNYTAENKLNYTFEGIISREGKNPFTISMTIPIDENSYAYTDTDYHELFISSGTGVNNFTIESDSIKLTDNDSNFCDFALIENNYNAGIIDGTSRYFDYETNDPRQNLREIDWQLTQSASPDTPDSTLINSVNSNFYLIPESDSDIEISADISSNPGNISTAYIRNAPMKSPWELGFIHRGNTWQTINLKKYNTAEGATSGAGGNSYSDGDANILDQIKMTSKNTTLGKVNLNNPGQDEGGNPLIALFTGINVGVKLDNKDDNPGYPDPGPGVRVTADTAAYLSEAIQDKIMTDDSLDTSKMFKTRAQVLKNITKFSDNTLGLSQDNDAKQEEIIGKFINLTKADGKKYDTENMTVLLIAQAIKDVGGVKSTTKGKFDQGKDVILSTTQALATLSKDPETDKWKIVNYEYIGD